MVMKRAIWFSLLIAGATMAHAQADYPGAIWNPAAPGNQSTSSRPTSFPIQYVVIHVTEGSYNGAISWFKNEASNVSAHFVIRSSDGQITQMVRLKDIAWHAGVSFYNQRSVGIEHEAITTQSGSNPNPSGWFTNAMYSASADLTRWLTNQFSIPRTRTFIIGHRETGAATSCPTNLWNWTTYMAFVTRGASFESTTIPVYMEPGQQVNVIVRFINTSDFSWTRAAGTNQVTLRTAPAGRNSAFVGGNWNSASIVGVPIADVPSNGTGEWQFVLRAPTTTGMYAETFQLNHSGTGPLGPEVTFNIGVGQVDKVVDNTSDDFVTFGGTWTLATSATDKFGPDYRFFTASTRTGGRAEWFLDAPVTGTYEVFAWWPQGTNRASQVTYEVVGRRGVQVRTVNQQTGGGTWNSLGRVSLNQGGGFVRMRARSGATGVVMADAVRIVGPVR